MYKTFEEFVDFYSRTHKKTVMKLGDIEFIGDDESTGSGNAQLGLPFNSTEYSFTDDGLKDYAKALGVAASYALKCPDDLKRENFDFWSEDLDDRIVTVETVNRDIISISPTVASRVTLKNILKEISDTYGTTDGVVYNYQRGKKYNLTDMSIKGVGDFRLMLPAGSSAAKPRVLKLEKIKSRGEEHFAAIATENSEVTSKRIDEIQFLSNLVVAIEENASHENFGKDTLKNKIGMPTEGAIEAIVSDLKLPKKMHIALVESVGNLVKPDDTWYDMAGFIASTAKHYVGNTHVVQEIAGMILNGARPKVCDHCHQVIPV